MIRRIGLIGVALAALLIASCVTVEGELFESVVASDAEATAKPGTDEDDGKDEVKSDEDGDAPGVRILTTPEAVSVYVDDAFAGKTPILLELDAGDYRIRLSRNGYYTEYLRVNFREGEYQQFEVTMTEITGYLYVSTEPRSAEVEIDGAPGRQGVTEVRVGPHLVKVRAFGYEPVEHRVIVFERQTTEVHARLSFARLAVDRFEASRRVLNPLNPGLLGVVAFTFEVTTWGSGSAEIRDRTGATVRSIPLDRFETWSQAVSWDGADDRGEALPDGSYTAAIVALGEEGTHAFSRPVEVLLSRKAVIAYRSGWSGAAGMLYAPTAEILPPSSFQISTLAAGTVTDSIGRVPIQAFFRFPLSEAFEVGIQGTAIMSSAGTTPIAAGVSVTYDIVGAGDGTSPIALAGYGVATFLARSTADTQTNFTGLRVGSVLTLRSGPIKLTGAVDLHASPYPATYELYGESAPAIDFSIWGYGRIGVLLDLPGFSAGLSTALRTESFTEGLALSLPVAAGAEIHWLIPETYVILSAIAFSEISGESDYYVSYGGGIGIIH